MLCRLPIPTHSLPFNQVDVTEDNVQVLLPAANLLQLTDVRDAACEFLQSQLHPTNCLGIRYCTVIILLYCTWYL